MQDIGNLATDQRRELRRAILRALIDEQPKALILGKVARTFGLRRTLTLKAEIARMAKRLEAVIE